MMESQVDRELLEKIADLIGKPVGAFNIRKDTGCDGRQSTENIQITGKTDGWYQILCNGRTGYVSAEFVTVEDDFPCDFALIAEGDSMIGDRIHSGDIVFIRSQDHVQDGEIAAVALDNEVTLKHVRRLRGPDGNVVFTQLLPSNPAYSPIDIGGEDETRMVRVLGKAVAVRFML